MHPKPTLQTVIVDDEERCIEALKHLLGKHCPQVKIIATCDSVATAMSTLGGVAADLVFLDVMLPDGTGFDILQKLDLEHTAVIFTTAHDEFALKAIKFSALDYLLKPVNPDELALAVGKAQRVFELHEIRPAQLQTLASHLSQNDGAKMIALPTLDGFSFVEVQEIIFCESRSNYTDVTMKNGVKLTVCKTIKEYEILLEEYGFFRIHNSHIINLQHLRKYVRGKGGYVILSNGKELEVSTRRKEAFLERLAL